MYGFFICRFLSFQESFHFLIIVNLCIFVIIIINIAGPPPLFFCVIDFYRLDVEILSEDITSVTAVVKADVENEKFPLKMRDAVVNAGYALLTNKGSSVNDFSSQIYQHLILFIIIITIAVLIYDSYVLNLCLLILLFWTSMIRVSPCG